MILAAEIFLLAQLPIGLGGQVVEVMEALAIGRVIRELGIRKFFLHGSSRYTSVVGIVEEHDF